MGITISQIILLIATVIVAIAGWDYRRGRDKKLLSLQRELAKEREKLRLLKLMHPEARNTDSTFYSYESTGCVVRKGENLEIIEYVCDIIASPEKDAEYYGYLIADLLNKNQETS